MKRNQVIAGLIMTIIVLAAFAILPLGATGATTIDDPLASDTHWTLGDSPVYVEDSFSVPAGVTLEIDAGVEIKINGAFTIFVDGTVVTYGTEAAPVLITSNQSVPAAGDWVGFVFNLTSSAKFVNTELSFADVPMTFNGTGNATLHNTTITESLNDDIVLTNNATLTAINCSYTSADPVEGTLYRGSWLTVQTVYQFNGTPIEDVDVMVTDNDSPVYASSSYTGTDPTTNATGMIGLVPVVAQTFDHNMTSVTNITKVYGKYELSQSSSYGLKNKKIENVNMSSNQDVQLVFDITGPAAVTEFKAVVISGSEINLSWTPPGDADLKNFIIFKYDGGSYSQIDTTDMNYIVISGLDDKTRYDFGIRAMDFEVTPNPSDWAFANATTWDVTAPAMPKNLTAVDITGSSISLEWSANTENDLDGYYVFSSNPDTGGWNPAVTVDASTTNHTFDSLVSETHYRFYVEAFDDWAPVPNNSTRSDILEIATLDVTAPDIPNINLPNSTTLSYLPIRGQILDNEKLVIVVHSDTRGYFNTTNSTGGIINQTIPLALGDNTIDVYAIDGAGNVGESFVKVVFCDYEAPEAVSQGNLAAETGDLVSMNASGSTDNHAIVSFEWSFIYNNATQTLSGEFPTFTFDSAHHYLVTLTVEDSLGNSDSTEFWINVTDKYIEPVDVKAPVVLDTNPADKGYNIDVNTTISVDFDEMVNLLNTSISIEGVTGTTTASADGMTVTFTPAGPLEYNTTYTVNVTAEDPAGNLVTLQWSFTTEEDPNIPPITTDDDTEDDDTEEEGLSPGTIFVMILIIVIIIGFIVVVIIVARKSMTEKDLIHDEVRADEDEDEDGWACPECSAPLSEGITYCYECGAEFTEEEAMEAGRLSDEDVDDIDEDDIDDEDEDEVEDVDEDEFEE